VQGAIESPHRGRSYLEKRRRIEGRVVTPRVTAALIAIKSLLNQIMHQIFV
jgi:hypothetical protein